MICCKLCAKTLNLFSARCSVFVTAASLNKVNQISCSEHDSEICSKGEKQKQAQLQGSLDAFIVVQPVKKTKQWTPITVLSD